MVIMVVRQNKGIHPAYVYIQEACIVKEQVTLAGIEEEVVTGKSDMDWEAVFSFQFLYGSKVVYQNIDC